MESCKGNSTGMPTNKKIWNFFFASFDLSQFSLKFGVYYMKNILFYHILSILTSDFQFSDTFASLCPIEYSTPYFQPKKWKSQIFEKCRYFQNQVRYWKSEVRVWKPWPRRTFRHPIIFGKNFDEKFKFSFLGWFCAIFPYWK